MATSDQEQHTGRVDNPASIETHDEANEFLNTLQSSENKMMTAVQTYANTATKLGSNSQSKLNLEQEYDLNAPDQIPASYQNSEENKNMITTGKLDDYKRENLDH